MFHCTAFHSYTVFRENLTNGLAPDIWSQQAAMVFPLGIMFYSLFNPWKLLQKLSFFFLVAGKLQSD